MCRPSAVDELFLIWEQCCEVHLCEAESCHQFVDTLNSAFSNALHCLSLQSVTLHRSFLGLFSSIWWAAFLREMLLRGARKGVADDACEVTWSLDPENVILKHSLQWHPFMLHVHEKLTFCYLLLNRPQLPSQPETLRCAGTFKANLG